MKKQRKEMQGITLIALVITIVVLLILAGVSIAMLSGENGIITQAQDAKDKNKKGEIEEQVRLAVMAAKTAGKGEIDFDELNSELDKIGYEGEDVTELPKEVTIDGVKVTIKEDGSIEIAGSGDNNNDDNDDDNNDEPPETIVGKSYSTETDIIVGETPVTVPGGATISGIAGEYESVDNGLVIYIMKDADGDNEIDTPNWEDEEYMQETYDQFVWVPVPNAIAVNMNDDDTVDATDIDLMIAAGKYPMAIATGTTTDDEGNTVTNYRGILYDFTEATDEEGKVTISVADKSYSATSGYREPAYLANTSSADGSSYNNVTPKITQELLQSEFNTMVNRVADKKGFWVGRYETSNMVGTASTSTSDALNKSTVEADTTNKITVIKGTTTGISTDSTIPNCINWYRMYAQQKNYSNLANISSTSSMIWGSQWDQIMIWMKEVDNESQGSKYVVNSIGMANYGNISGVDDGYSSTLAPAATGCFDVKNVYDLAGNVYDWTLEASGTGFRVLRRRLLRRYVYV